MLLLSFYPLLYVLTSFCFLTNKFQGMAPIQMLDILLEEVKDKGAEEVKKCIRKEIRRWHPDKFLQKVGARVAPDQQQGVMDRVKGVSQALNNYGK